MLHRAASIYAMWNTKREQCWLSIFLFFRVQYELNTAWKGLKIRPWSLIILLLSWLYFFIYLFEFILGGPSAWLLHSFCHSSSSFWLSSWSFCLSLCLSLFFMQLYNSMPACLPAALAEALWKWKNDVHTAHSPRAGRIKRDRTRVRQQKHSYWHIYYFMPLTFFWIH